MVNNQSHKRVIYEMNRNRIIILRPNLLRYHKTGVENWLRVILIVRAEANHHIKVKAKPNVISLKLSLDLGQNRNQVEAGVKAKEWENEVLV